MKNWILIICVLSNTFSCKAQEQNIEVSEAKGGSVKFSFYKPTKSWPSNIGLSEIRYMEGTGRNYRPKDTIIIRGSFKKDTLFNTSKNILQYFMSVETQSEYDRLFGKEAIEKIPKKFKMGRFFDHELMRITKGIVVKKDNVRYELYGVTIINSIINSVEEDCIIIARENIKKYPLSKKEKSELSYHMLKVPPEFLRIYVDFFRQIRPDVLPILFEAPLDKIKDEDIREMALYTRTPLGSIFDVHRFYELIERWKSRKENDNISKILIL